MKTFILQLQDNTCNYDDICVKIHGKDIQDIQNKLKKINIKEKIKDSFSDKNFDFVVRSFYDIDLMTTLDEIKLV